MRCGLLGEHLAHSYSPRLHTLLGGSYTYELFEVAPAQLDGFLRGDAFDGLNVTVPYKQAVLPYCAALSETARLCGSVNILLRRSDGTLYGDNTDFDGFFYLLSRNGGITPGETALVLGTGGASKTAQAVLRAQGARVIALSHRENTPEAVRASGASLLVNATPVGMYPHNGECPIAPEQLPSCRLVLDLIYHPAKTALLLAAQERGIPCDNGLAMLVAQAARAAALFTASPHTETAEQIEKVLCKLQAETRNVIFIGMPGCGKSTIGRRFSEQAAMPFFDCDAILEARLGCTASAFLRKHGEAAFRARETALLAELGKCSGGVIATGGGCVTRAENLRFLRQNGILLWLQRDLNRLATEGRPLLQAKTPAVLYAERRAAYEAFADRVIDNNGTPEETLHNITEVLQ